MGDTSTSNLFNVGQEVWILKHPVRNYGMHEIKDYREEFIKVKKGKISGFIPALYNGDTSKYKIEYVGSYTEEEIYLSKKEAMQAALKIEREDLLFAEVALKVRYKLLKEVEND